MVPESSQADVSLQSVFHAAALGIALMDRDGCFVRCNPAFRALLGYDDDALIGHSFTEFTHVGDVSAHAILLGQLLDGDRHSYELPVRYLHRDGDVIHSHLTASRLQEGIALTIVRDVSAEWGARDQLRRSQEQLGIALAAVELGFWEWEVASDQLIWSDEMARFVGMDPTPGVHRFGAHFDVIHPEDVPLVTNAVRTAMNDPTRGVVDCEFRVVRADGEERWFLAKAHIFRDEQGDAQRVLGALIDITRGRLLQQQFLQAQKMETLGTFASSIAHDFNNALMVIMGHCDVLAMGDPTPETLQQALFEISGATQRAAHLTRQLLTFSRKDAIDPRLTNPNDTLRGLEGFMRPLTREHQLRLQLSSAISAIRIDERHLEQAIINLVVNARDAMVEAGVITIRTDMAPDRWVSIAVTDTGTGIDETIRARLFEPFFTTKPPGKGTGLGLAVVLAVAEEGNGTIGVESTPGGGATFELRFPAAS